MKQLLFATVTFMGMSSAALAAEPLVLAESQLDQVTAGLTLSSQAFGYTAAVKSAGGGQAFADLVFVGVDFDSENGGPPGPPVTISGLGF